MSAGCVLCLISKDIQKNNEFLKLNDDIRSTMLHSLENYSEKSFNDLTNLKIILCGQELSENIEQIKCIYSFLLSLPKENSLITQAINMLPFVLSENPERKLKKLVSSIRNLIFKESKLIKICEFYRFLSILKQYKILKEFFEGIIHVAIFNLIDIKTANIEDMANIIISLNEIQNESSSIANTFEIVSKKFLKTIESNSISGILAQAYGIASNDIDNKIDNKPIKEAPEGFLVKS